VAAAVESARVEGERRAREIVLTAIERLAHDGLDDATVCRVPVESEEMRGRVIGRDGRNVKAFEAVTGCDVLVDEPPGHVTISSFDPLRREVARRSLELLLEDGRVQPGRIEETVAEVQRRVEAGLPEEGRVAAAEAGVDHLSPALLGMLGRLRYRTSYGQNVLRHSVEAAHLAGAIAAELGLDERLARRTALLHDLGKAVDASVGGAHHVVAAAVLRREGEAEVVAASVETSHDAAVVSSPYAVLAQVADALSAARPGARREDASRYVRRVQDLEAIAAAFPGVTQAYAIQAGHELRVLVDAARVSDATAPRLAYEIARAIEERGAVLGEVKVTVVREVRAVEIAR
jgi:ribonuclease Y